MRAETRHKRRGAERRHGTSDRKGHHPISIEACDPDFPEETIVVSEKELDLSSKGALS